MDDIADLVVTPFRDIVEKGQTAVENAGDTQPMLKAAQSLVKEGERALKRIEPLCRKQLEEYGSNFLDALKENDVIANFRTELNDLLWEFDDYTEVDDFDAEKYAELQALSRKAAPKIYDILMRMKLEVPVDNDARSIVMMRMSSRPSSPPPMPPPPLPVSAPEPVRPRTSHAPPERKISSPPTVEEATAQLRRMMQSQSGPDEGFELPPQKPVPVEQPPRPPSANPWDVKTPPVARERRMRDDFAFERRAPVASPESPIEAISPVSPARKVSSSRPRPMRTGTDRSSHQSSHHSSHHTEERSLSPTVAEPGSYERSYNIFPSPGQRARTPNGSSFLSTSIPEDFSMDRERGMMKPAYPARTSSQTSPYPQHVSRPESWDSDPSSVFDNRRTDRDSNSGTSEPHSSTVSAAPTSPTLGTSELSPTSPVPPNGQHGFDTLSSRHAPEMDYGPIPVETEREPANPHLHLSTVDCTIAANSSFYLHKGFCEGAQEVIRGGVGIRKTKRPGFTGATTVARCTNCFYELDFDEVGLDVNKHDRGNFTKHGIGFRIRFLQKSHLPTRRVDDVMYGCLFCIHQTRTLNASDATVFTSQKALFQHLARHPRPLPEIPGVTVIDAAEIPEAYRNNYDLHFRNPTEMHPVVEKANEIALLPTGTAKEAARRMYGQRLLFDRTPALEMVQGAKITGITWPEKYLGEWAFGWHDGVHASVPMEILRLDQPPAKEIKMAGTSQIRGIARWKFNPKDKDKFKGDWLKFDKDEVISNINWPYEEYWCWSGTNSKGKWGIFPQAFIDLATVHDMSAANSDRASILSGEKSRSGSMLTRFSTRKSARGRPPSIAGSTGSHETAPPTLPPTYMFSRN